MTSRTPSKPFNIPTDNSSASLFYHGSPLRRFSTRLILVFTALLVSAMLIFTWHSAHNEVRQITANKKLHARVLANNLSAAGAGQLLKHDYTSIKQLLMRSVKFPGVMTIQVTDADGKIVNDVYLDIDDTPRVRYGKSALQPPAEAGQVIYNDDSQIAIWEPLLQGDLIGWIKITYSLQDIRETAVRTWFSNILFGIVIILVTIPMLLAVIRRPLAAISNYTEFAEQLDKSDGSQIGISYGSLELEYLGAALNRASRRLHKQSLTINNAINELKRLASFPENNPNIVASLNRNGDIIYINPHGKSILEEFDLEEDQLHMLLPPELQEIIKNTIREKESTHAIEVEYHGRTLSWIFAPTSDQDLVHCYSHEITEIKQAEGQTHAAQFEKSTAEAASKTNDNLLLAEDNRDNQRLMSLYLKHLGCRVDIAENGRQAVEMAMRTSYDVILMDMQMPEMDGLQAIRQLRDNGCQSTVISLTASTRQEDIQRCYQAGCDDFIAKPVDRAHFNQVISKYLKSAGPVKEDSPAVHSILLEESESFATLVNEFIDNFIKLLDEMDDLYKKQNWKILQNRTHDLKGSGGGYGYPQISEIASRIETASKNAEYHLLPEMLLELRQLAVKIIRGRPA